MDLNGLPNKIFNAVIDIYNGRNGLATDGAEHEGRISYEIGIADASSAFQEAQDVGDLKILILGELAFLQQELQFCSEADTFTLSSLTQASGSFEDAFHLACIAHRTRLMNVLRSPGINMIEKTVLQQRIANMTAA